MQQLIDIESEQMWGEHTSSSADDGATQACISHQELWQQWMLHLFDCTSLFEWGEWHRLDGSIISVSVMCTDQTEKTRLCDIYIVTTVVILMQE